MRIIPAYWVYFDKHDGNGFEKVRTKREGGGWGFACTIFQVRKAKKAAKAHGWGFKSQRIPKPAKVSIPKKKYPNDTHYTPHFSRAEMKCKDGTSVPAEFDSRMFKLCKGLEQMRAELGPLTVLSAYRTAEYNHRIGGASQSQHIQGRAADLVTSVYGQHRMVEAAEKVPQFHNGGIGVYPSGGLHVDVRGYLARWSSF